MFEDFDRYCDEHDITPEEAPAAFAAWLHEVAGWDGDMSEVKERLVPADGQDHGTAGDDK